PVGCDQRGCKSYRASANRTCAAATWDGTNYSVIAPSEVGTVAHETAGFVCVAEKSRQTWSYGRCGVTKGLESRPCKQPARQGFDSPPDDVEKSLSLGILGARDGPADTRRARQGRARPAGGGRHGHRARVAEDRTARQGHLVPGGLRRIVVFRHPGDR